jgi:phage shock protein A
MGTMTDFLDKLNTLLRANLRDFLGGSAVPAERPLGRLPDRIPPEKLGKEIDRELASLRRQVDTALNTEERLKENLAKSQAAAEQLDKDADQALQSGDETLARTIVGQLQGQRKRIRKMEEELEIHRNATFDLIQHVNTLEALISDARREMVERGETPPPMTETKPAAPAINSEAINNTVRAASTLLSDVLRDVREKVEHVITPAPGTAKEPNKEGESKETPPSTPPTSHSIAVQGASTTDSAAPTSAPQKVPVNVKPAPPAPDPSSDVVVNPVKIVSRSAVEDQPDAPVKTATPTVPSVPSGPTNQEIEEDLARRRSRLSKPE